jgi:hypothetical protein
MAGRKGSQGDVVQWCRAGLDRPWYGDSLAWGGFGECIGLECRGGAVVVVVAQCEGYLGSVSRRCASRRGDKGDTDSDEGESWIT